MSCFHRVLQHSLIIPFSFFYSKRIYIHSIEYKIQYPCYSYAFLISCIDGAYLSKNASILLLLLLLLSSLPLSSPLLSEITGLRLSLIRQRKPSLMWLGIGLFVEKYTLVFHSNGTEGHTGCQFFWKDSYTCVKLRQFSKKGSCHSSIPGCSGGLCIPPRRLWDFWAVPAAQGTGREGQESLVPAPATEPPFTPGHSSSSGLLGYSMRQSGILPSVALICQQSLETDSLSSSSFYLVPSFVIW